MQELAHGAWIPNMRCLFKMQGLLPTNTKYSVSRVGTSRCFLHGPSHRVLHNL